MQQGVKFNEVGQIGRWFFQNRSLTPLVLVCLLIVLPPTTEWSLLWHRIWMAIIFLSECLRFWAVGYAGSATRTRGDSVPNLVVAGPFRFVRNPLYLANISMYTAMGFLYGNIGLACVVLALSSIQYVFIVAYEEQLLLQSFGAAYSEFTEKVPRWIPRLIPSSLNSHHAYRFFAALRSERSTLLALTCMLILLKIKQMI